MSDNTVPQIDQSTWPEHLRDDAPYQRCGRCGRCTYSTYDFGTECRMTRLDGFPCGGQFGPQVHRDEPFMTAHVTQTDLTQDRAATWLAIMDLADRNGVDLPRGIATYPADLVTGIPPILSLNPDDAAAARRWCEIFGVEVRTHSYPPDDNNPFPHSIVTGNVQWRGWAVQWQVGEDEDGDS